MRLPEWLVRFADWLGPLGTILAALAVLLPFLWWAGSSVVRFLGRPQVEAELMVLRSRGVSFLVLRVTNGGKVAATFTGSLKINAVNDEPPKRDHLILAWEEDGSDRAVIEPGASRHLLLALPLPNGIAFPLPAPTTGRFRLSDEARYWWGTDTKALIRGQVEIVTSPPGNHLDRPMEFVFDQGDHYVMDEGRRVAF